MSLKKEERFRNREIMRQNEKNAFCSLWIALILGILVTALLLLFPMVIRKSLAPTQQLLRVWIEKRKKLSVSVVFKIEKGRMKYVPCIANLKTKTVETLPKSFFSYKTAMEKGLFYALS